MREIGFAGNMSFKQEYAFNVFRVDEASNTIYFFDDRGALRIRTLKLLEENEYTDVYSCLVYSWREHHIQSYFLDLYYNSMGTLKKISGLSAFRRTHSSYKNLNATYTVKLDRNGLSQAIRNSLHVGSQEKIIVGRCRFNSMVDLREGMLFSEYIAEVLKVINEYVNERLVPNSICGVTCPYVVSKVGSLSRELDLISNTYLNVVVVTVPKTCSNEELIAHKEAISKVVLASIGKLNSPIRVSNMYRSSDSELRVILQGI